MTEERRQAPRIRAYRPVRLHSSGIAQPIETLTKDISQGGARFLSVLLIPVGTELQLELALVNGQEPITGRGRATWFRALPDSEQFEVGLSFSNFPDHEQRRLSACLSRLTPFLPA